MSVFLSVLELAFLIFVVLFEYYFIFSFFRSKMGKYPPYVPTRKGMAKAILDEVSPLLQEAAEPLNVTEPGCGDARVIATLAEHFPQHLFKGYEWDYVPYFFAKIRTRKIKNVQILRQNFMTADYTRDNLVILFTGDEIAAELSKKLLTDLPDKAVILSESFKVPGLPCVKEISTAKENYFFLPPKMYVYEVNRPKAG